MYLAGSLCDDGPTSLQVDPQLLSILRQLAKEVVSETVFDVPPPPTSSCLPATSRRPDICSKFQGGLEALCPLTPMSQTPK